jgi:hypothetical protein
MSKPREENPELARVLSRVNALMKHDLETSAQEAQNQEAPVQEDGSAEVEVPVLTEVYEGELPVLAVRSLDELPPPVTASQTPQVDDAALEAIVADLMPLIRAEVKKAVRQELVNTEKIVNHRLETEFIQTLLEKLRAERDG